MENTMETPVTAPEPTAEQKALQNQLGVIQVVERLFKGVNAGSYPLSAQDDVMAGMNFLAQFHKQLVGQLPPEELAKIRAAQEGVNVEPKAS